MNFDEWSAIGNKLPKYRSHKVVQAAKLLLVERYGDGTLMLYPADESLEPFTVDDEWSARYSGHEDDYGYYVRYEDGYASWSPTKAFEDGYTRVEA